MDNVSSTIVAIKNSNNVAYVIIYAVGNGVNTITATPITWIVK